MWYSESALLVCSFEHGAAPRHAPPTIAERIDAALGISATPHRAMLGDVELTWQDESRLQSIELRTARSQWQPASLRSPLEKVEQASMALQLEYDANGIASLELGVRVLWDQTLSRIALRFGDAEPEAGRWVAIADDAFVCVDEERGLVEIRFANARIALEES